MFTAKRPAVRIGARSDGPERGNIQACRDADLFEITQPRGDTAGRDVDAHDAGCLAAVGKADGGTAGVVALLNVCSWMTGLFPQQAQDDVWVDDPDALVSGVLTPSSESRKVEGGYRVTGRWFWNSGSYQASWAVLGIPVTDGRGEVEVELVFVIGRHAHRVSAGDAFDCVAGYSVGQDISERVRQMAATPPQFSMGKSLPGFGPRRTGFGSHAWVLPGGGAGGLSDQVGDRVGVGDEDGV
ncbi:fumarylacetoacetate hydrolase family protein [Streptomyces sp. NPDC087844]|uniref:fumarylacetoacetate hydrolase family protein n=1 Tax=Streptomyces sp. NPDC087844 TaxID=3365805 RepID=UPI00381C2F4C